MTAKPVSLIDKMLERNAPKPIRPPDPVCPICSTEGGPVRLLRTTHGVGGYRCPRCRLLFPAPPPTAEELPALERCPECLKHDRINWLVWLDGQVMWCSFCNFSREVLTTRQQALREQVARLAVNGCYGDACRRPKIKGGKSSGRNRGKGNKGFTVITPLHLVPVKQPTTPDVVLERSSTRKKKR